MANTSHPGDLWTNSTANASIVSNLTSLCGSVHDIELDRTYRLLILYLTISLSVVGSILVVVWMLCNRRMSSNFNHLSRVNLFILHLTIADILVILLAVLPQLIWEYADRDWRAGDVMCRLVKFLQSFSMMASNYMVVVIAVDRHQAIRAPLKEAFSVGIMVRANSFRFSLIAINVKIWSLIQGFLIPIDHLAPNASLNFLFIQQGSSSLSDIIEET